MSEIKDTINNQHFTSTDWKIGEFWTRMALGQDETHLKPNLK